MIFEPGKPVDDVAEMLPADPVKVLGLPAGAVVVSAVLLVEYMELDAEERPGARRLAWSVNDDLPPWTAAGMMRLAGDTIIAECLRGVQG